jgi:hypothetical protein
MGRGRKAAFPAFWRNNGRGNGNGRRKLDNRPKKFQFEALEPRILSADLTYSGTAAFDLILRLDDDTQTLQLLDAGTLSPVAEQALSQTSSVIITGSSEADRLTVDLGAAFDLAGGITFTDPNAGDGDTLEVTGKAESTWTIGGPDSGSVSGGGGTVFSGIENLEGGDGNRDHFTLTGAGNLSGAIDAGDGGDDTLLVLDGTNTWHLTEPGGGSVVTADGTGTSLLRLREPDRR